MPSPINHLPPPPCPDAGAQGRGTLSDDVALNILQQAEVNKQFKRVCEADALWRPWWSCGPRAPEGIFGTSARYDDLMRQPQQVRDDLAKLWRLKVKQRSRYDNDEVAVIARRNIGHQRLFFFAVELNPTVLEFAPPAWLEDDRSMTQAIAANRLVLGYAPNRFMMDSALVAKALRAPMQRMENAKCWKTDDQKLLLEAIKDVGPEVLVHASGALHGDVNFIAQAVAVDSRCLKHATDSAKYRLELPLRVWLEDNGAMARAIEQNGDMLQYAPEPMRQDRALLVAALKSSWEAIEYVPDWAKADADLILQVLTSEHIQLLDKVATSLKNDRCFMDRALDVDARSLYFAAKPLRADRNLVQKSMRQGYLYSLSFASAQLWDDREFMLEAVKLSGFALKYASARLRADKTLVMHAVKTDGFALGHATKALWDDRDLLLASYEQKADFFGREGKWSERDVGRMRDSFGIDGYRDDIPATLEADREVVLAYHSYRARMPVRMVEDVFLAKKLAGDQELIGKLQNLGIILPLWSLSRAVRHNRALALQAVRTDSGNLRYVSAKLRNDPSFVLEAYALNSYCLRYAPDWLRNHKPFILKACKAHDSALKWASDRLQKDPEVVSEAALHHPGAIRYAAWELYEAFARLHPDADIPAHVGEGQDSVSSDSSAYWRYQRRPWSKTWTMGRLVANSPFALKALLMRSAMGNPMDKKENNAC